MHRDLKRGVRRVQATYRLLGKVARRSYLKWGRLLPQGDWPTYVAAIEREDWAELARVARAHHRRDQAALHELLAARRALAPHVALNAQVAVAFQTHTVPPRLRPEWDQVRSRLASELRRRGRTPNEITQFIARVAALDAGTVPRAHLQALRSHEDRLETFARRATAGLMGAHLAAAVAAFNRPRRAGRASGAAAFARRAIRTIEATERGFHRTLRRGQIPGVPLGPGSEVERNLREGVTWAGRIAAVRRAGSGASARDDRSALLVGDALRALLRHVALRHRLTWLGAADPESPERARWLRMADERAFATAWRAPRERALDALARRPRAVPDGTPITLGGTLGPVTIRHVGPDPVSTATVRDRRRRFEVLVIAKHRKFDSSGMVGGSSVRVSGSWEHRTPETAGPALRLGRQRLAELATQSWTDWVTAELREVYEPSPQALTIRWSWEPGRDGAGNPLRYRVWFPEERRPLT